MHRRRDAGRREPGAVVGVEHLDVLDSRHERLAGGSGRQDVERDAHGRVPDGVDLGRDAPGGGSRHPLREAVAVRHPDAAAAFRGDRSVGLVLDVLEERRGP